MLEGNIGMGIMTAQRYLNNIEVYL